jgi:hypothetical protein
MIRANNNNNNNAPVAPKVVEKKKSEADLIREMGDRLAAINKE